MIEVFSHADYGRVTLVRSVLENNGIPCVLRGEEKRELIPGVPEPSYDPSLSVRDEDAEKARAAVQTFLAEEKQRTSEDWKCAECGEMVPPNFDSCWKCDTLRPGVER